MDTETVEPIEMISPPQLTDSRAVPVSGVLQRKIRGMRRKFLLVAAVSGFAAAVGAAVALLMVGTLLNWWLTLGREVRAIMLAVDGIVFLWIGARYIVRPILSAPDDDMLALMVER